MSLIMCSECGKEVSDKAKSCPHCGNPISSELTDGIVDARVVGTVEIVRTNKKWKKRTLWALGFMFLGLMSMGNSVGLGFFLIFVGFITLITAAIGSWWTNG